MQNSQTPLSCKKEKRKSKEGGRMQVVIIGGGAGGSSCAARLRRLDEKAEIIVLEQSEETSIASCGLPYYVGNVIQDRNNMQVASPQMFKSLFNIDVRLNSKVDSINTKEKSVRLANGENINYDKLVLATGTLPFIPETQGLQNIASFTLKSLADADKIKSYIEKNKISSALVVGGGFIGVEVAENLRHLGLETSLLELADQVLLPLDKDMVIQIHQEMRHNQIKLYLKDSIKEVTNNQEIILNSGKKIKAEMIIMAVGIKPNTDLAKESGIALTERGLIKTNEFMQTNISDIYACGDNVAVKDFVSEQETMIALAGPANRQGRCIADHICGNTPYPYQGTQGTGIVKVFTLTAAFTGNNEKQLQRSGIAYEKMLIQANSHAGYYPDAQALTLKVLYQKDGKILGAQAVGKQGVDKRIDVIASIMRLHGTTKDLRDAELCYAPPYSSAKDPVNLIGMAIENIRQGLVKPYFGTDFTGMTVLDVRPAKVYEQAHISGAVNIPAAQIRQRKDELPKDKPLMVHCFKGYTSYVVCRILSQEGFKEIYSYAGGWQQYQQEEAEKKAKEED